MPLQDRRRIISSERASPSKRARGYDGQGFVQSNISGDDISGSSSNLEDEGLAKSSVNTPSTPPSSKPSPRHPSDINKIHHCYYADCSKSFNRPAKLSQHIRSHTNTRPFVCPHEPCVKNFLRESHLKHHMKSAHSDTRDHVCQWQGCGKAFITATRLRRHHAAHEGKEKFRCTFAGCGQTFRKHGTLQKHTRTIHEGIRPFSCHREDDNGMECGMSFMNQGQLRSHMRRVHGGKAYICALCPSNDDEEGKDSCGITFSTHADLQAHVTQEHPPTCGECDLKCASQSALKSHFEVIHGGFTIDERRTHICPESGCARGFSKKGNLNVHIQISHRGQRFTCGGVDPQLLETLGDWGGLNGCGKALSSKRNLENHIRIAHLGLDGSGKANQNKNIPLQQPPSRNQVSALTRLTGAGYGRESGRHIACPIKGCVHLFCRQYDLTIHLESHHELGAFERQEIP